MPISKIFYEEYDYAEIIDYVKKDKQIKIIVLSDKNEKNNIPPQIKSNFHFYNYEWLEESYEKQELLIDFDIYSTRGAIIKINKQPKMKKQTKSQKIIEKNLKKDYIFINQKRPLSKMSDKNNKDAPKKKKQRTN